MAIVEKSTTSRLVSMPSTALQPRSQSPAISRPPPLPITTAALTQSVVRGWMRKAQEESAGGGDAVTLAPTERKELERLRRENKQLRVEREILKKAATFFAKESP